MRDCSHPAISSYSRTVARLTSCQSRARSSQVPSTSNNLEVEDYHTYYVASSGVWVHNCTSYSGGTYSSLDAAEGIERHHLIADSISPLSKGRGPAIQMDTPDHYMTGSWGNSASAQTYRAGQAAFANSDNLQGAFDMDVRNIQGLFGSKYDIAIQQARAAAQWR